MRIQLAQSDQSWLTPEAYNQLFTMHGMTMIFWYAAPNPFGICELSDPADDWRARYGFSPPECFFLLDVRAIRASCSTSARLWGSRRTAAGLLTPHTPAFVTRPGYGMDFYCLALIFLTISTTVGAINFIVTIFRLRAPGMTISRMPLFLYSTLTISFAILMSLPALTVACVFLELDRRWGTHFFDSRLGGEPLLWQQLFWFFGHPWVYVVFLPATGMIVDDHPGLFAAADRRLPVRCDLNRADGRRWFWSLAASHVCRRHV